MEELRRRDSERASREGGRRIVPSRVYQNTICAGYADADEDEVWEGAAGVDERSGACVAQRH